MRYHTLTVSILAAFFLSACAEAAQDNERSNQSPEINPVSTKTAQQDAPDPFRRNMVTEMFFSENFYAEKLPLSERFQGLDPKEISQVEIDELMALEKQQKESLPAFRLEQQAWARQDPASRGPEPVYRAIPQAERLQALWYKAALAEIQKKYANFDPRVLSRADAEEMVALEKARAAIEMEDQKKLTAWYKRDSATRGPRPGRLQAGLAINNPRLKELQAKVRVAKEVKRETDRIEQLSKAHNISILDNEMSEFIQLHKEQSERQGEMQNAVMQALIGEDGQIDPKTLAGLTGGQISGEVLNKLPKNLLFRMSETSQRLEAIEAPFIAAEKADKIRKDMAELSKTSGVPISFADIEETVSLNAEKDRILKNAQLEAARKWTVNGGPASDVQNPLPNAGDAARLKLIEAKLKAISAPMVETK